MEKQPFIDRILETENLSDELEDADANWLLNWGIGQLDVVLKDVILKDTLELEAAGAKVNALMAVMRKINRICGSYTDKLATDLSQDLKALQTFHDAAFGHTAEALPDEFLIQTATHLVKLPVRQVLEALTRPGFQVPRPD